MSRWRASHLRASCLEKEMASSKVRLSSSASGPLAQGIQRCATAKVADCKPVLLRLCTTCLHKSDKLYLQNDPLHMHINCCCQSGSSLKDSGTSSQNVIMLLIFPLGDFTPAWFPVCEESKKRPQGTEAAKGKKARNGSAEPRRRVAWPLRAGQALPAVLRWSSSRAEVQLHLQSGKGQRTLQCQCCLHGSPKSFKSSCTCQNPVETSGSFGLLRSHAHVHPGHLCLRPVRHQCRHSDSIRMADMLSVHRVGRLITGIM